MCLRLLAALPAGHPPSHLCSAASGLLEQSFKGAPCIICKRNGTPPEAHLSPLNAGCKVGAPLLCKTGLTSTGAPPPPGNTRMALQTQRALPASSPELLLPPIKPGPLACSEHTLYLCVSSPPCNSCHPFRSSLLSIPSSVEMGLHTFQAFC